MTQPLTNLVMQKLHLNLPSFGGQLLNEEYSTTSNLSDVLRRIREQGTYSECMVHSFNFKPSQANIERLNILSIGASVVTQKGITPSGHDLLIVVPTLSLSQHVTSSLEHVSHGTQSLISELRFNPVEVELSSSETNITNLQERVIQNVISDPNLKNLLKGWHVDIVLIHGTVQATAQLSQLTHMVKVGYVRECTEQCAFLEKLSGEPLLVRNEEAIRKEMLVTTSPTGTPINLIVTDGVGKRLAYMGNRATPDDIIPYLINIFFDDSKRSILLNMFLSQHFADIAHNVAHDTDITIPESELNRMLITTQQGIEDAWLSGLED